MESDSFMHADPGHFLQQLAMAVCQQKERLQQVPVTALAPTQTQLPPNATTAGPPSEQMLQNALASLRRIPAETDPAAATATDAANSIAAANSCASANRNSRPSDPFGPKLSTSTTRDSFEPTVYLDDLGIGAACKSKCSLYNRASQSMRPSFAPAIAECVEQEALSLTPSPWRRPSMTSAQHSTAATSAARSISLAPPAGSPHMAATTAPHSNMGTGLPGSHTSHKACTPATPGSASVGLDTLKPTIAPPASSPHVAACQSNQGHGSHTSQKACTAATPGSVSVGLHTLNPTPSPAAAQSVQQHESRQPMSHVAPAYAGTPAASVGVATGQENKSPQQLQQTQQVDLAEYLRQKHILSRLQTLLPEGSVDVLEDVEGFLSQVKKRMGLVDSNENKALVEGCVKRHANANAKSPGLSIAASALTVQQELKRGLGQGKDLMTVRSSAPQATTVSRMSAPVHLNPPEHSQVRTVPYSSTAVNLHWSGHA